MTPVEPDEEAVITHTAECAICGTSRDFEDMRAAERWLRAHDQEEHPVTPVEPRPPTSEFFRKLGARLFFSRWPGLLNAIKKVQR